MSEAALDSFGVLSRSDFSLSVSRALRILSLFAADRPELAASEISQALSLSKTSTLRFIQALEMHGYLERNPLTRRYFPGMEAARVGSLYAGNIRLNSLSLPIIEKFVEQYGFTAYLADFQNDRMIIRTSVEATGPLKYNMPVGSKLPMHSTATGQAALAQFDAGAVDALVARTGLPAYTAKTVTTLPALRKSLKDTRARGYAVNWEEHVNGVGSVASPVNDPSGKLLAVLSIGFATSQVPRNQIALIGDAIRKAAETIARRLAGSERHRVA